MEHVTNPLYMRVTSHSGLPSTEERQKFREIMSKAVLDVDKLPPGLISALTHAERHSAVRAWAEIWTPDEQAREFEDLYNTMHRTWPQVSGCTVELYRTAEHLPDDRVAIVQLTPNKIHHGQRVYTFLLDPLHIQENY